MYTFGWVTSVSPLAQAEFWNSAFMGTSINFVNFYNKSMDYYSNGVLYASTTAQWQTAAIGIANVAMQQLPYSLFYFENTLYANYVNGWTGYANEPTVGPNTGGGIYYTLLNVHSTTNSTGGNLNYGIHQQADTGGMNPMYATNWVWQVDIWSEIFDTPLATPPTEFTTVNAFLNYMTTSYSVTSYTGKVPSGSFIFQKPAKTGITNGQMITFTFANNLTWSDNTPFTAKDYQTSLYYWNLAYSAKLPDESTPDTGILSGPSGLIASKVVSTNTIELFINSNSIWNLANSVVPVFPTHILQYFNPDHFSTAVSDVDTTQPYLSASSYAIYGAPKAPKWVTYEPNMEIGSGPFTLTTYSETTGDGVLTANPNYFRAAWYANMPTLTSGTPYTNNYTISMYINNPSISTPYCGVAPSSTGYCPLTGKVPGESSVKLKGVVTLYLCTGVNANTGAVVGCTLQPGTYNLVQHIAYTCTNSGVYANGKCPKGDKVVKTYTNGYYLSVPTTTLAAGTYEVVLTTHFSFQGLARTYYQATGFVLS